MGSDLSPIGRRMLFVREYLRTGNAQESAVVAGYKVLKNGTCPSGRRLLAQPAVRRAIAKANEITNISAIMSDVEAKTRLTAIARGQAPTVIEVKKDADGAVKSSSETYSPITAIDSLSKKMGWDAAKQVSVQGIILNINV